MESVPSAATAANPRWSAISSPPSAVGTTAAAVPAKRCSSTGSTRPSRQSAAEHPAPGDVHPQQPLALAMPDRPLCELARLGAGDASLDGSHRSGPR